MKILYFSFVELDIPNACQTHTLGVLQGFSHNSCEVDAVVPRPKKVRPLIPGVRFYYLWPWRFSALGRLWTKILGAAYFFALCLLKKYDAIYVRELEVNPCPRLCSIIFRIPLYIEINSILLRQAKMAGLKRSRMLRVERHQASDFKQATGLIVPSFPRYNWILEHYGLNPNIAHMILNGTNIPIVKKTDRSIVLKKLKLPQNGFYLGFLGNVWGYYDLDTIFKAMELCLEEIPDLHMIMIGGGAEIDNLGNKIQERQLISRLIFLGYIHPELLFQIMGAIDIGLMNLTKKGLNDGGPITTRFATYAAFQLPIIANNMYIKGYAEDLIQGLSLVPPEDPRALADAILWLYNHPEERKERANYLHDFVIKKLTWNAITKEILEIINKDKKLCAG
ncbi:MAG: glycosyltransferase [Candidatus Aminicenantes bacterium]|nr:glycosyltransferase [Candidatus Aminicenantes bacterium]